MKKIGALLLAVALFVVLFVVVLTDEDGDGQCQPGDRSAGGSSAQAVIDGDYAYPTERDKTTVTSPFGLRDIGQGVEGHDGVDLGGPRGTKIFAFADGKVIAAADQGVQGFGGWVVLDHNIDGQQIQTVYGHMEPGQVHVQVGDTVTKGQHIADMGSGGRSTGDHLHFEVVKGDRAAGGERVDPQPWLDRIGQGDSAGESESREEPSEESSAPRPPRESESPRPRSGGQLPPNPNEDKEVPIGIAQDEGALDEWQIDHIRAIISIGKGRKEDPKLIKAALMAGGLEGGYRMLASRAVPESLNFPNDGVTAGDALSVGIFAIQTPMNGTIEEAMDRDWQINWFYDTAHQQANLEGEPWEIAADTERPREDLRWKYQLWDEFADKLLESEGNIAPSESRGACPPSGQAPSGEIPANASEFAQAAIKAAREQFGQQYVWGGGDQNGPTSGQENIGPGFDCSGLTLYAYAQASGGRLVLPHFTGDPSNPGQMYDPRLEDVPLDKIQPGDLVFFGSGGSAHHVGLAISGDKMIHAPQSGDVVREAGIQDMGDLMAAKRPKADALGAEDEEKK